MARHRTLPTTAATSSRRAARMASRCSCQLACPSTRATPHRTLAAHHSRPHSSSTMQSPCPTWTLLATCMPTRLVRHRPIPRHSWPHSHPTTPCRPCTRRTTSTDRCAPRPLPRRCPPRPTADRRAPLTFLRPRPWCCRPLRASQWCARDSCHRKDSCFRARRTDRTGATRTSARRRCSTWATVARPSSLPRRADSPLDERSCCKRNKRCRRSNSSRDSRLGRTRTRATTLHRDWTTPRRALPLQPPLRLLPRTPLEYSSSQTISTRMIVH